MLNPLQRCLKPIRVKLNISEFSTNTDDYCLDLDSHADICVLGNNALIFETPYPERTAEVSFAALYAENPPTPFTLCGVTSIYKSKRPP